MRVARELLAAPDGPEWELSRWVLDRMMDGAEQTVVDPDPVAWVDLRRGRGDATKDAVLALLRPGDAFVTLDAGSPSVAFPVPAEGPGGETWHFVQGRHENANSGSQVWSSFSRRPATGGLTALFQAAWGFDASTPERAEASSKRLDAASAQFLRGGAFAPDRDDALWPGARRVIVSIAPPFGVLPLDLVPRSEGGKPLLDEVEWTFVTSPSEFLECSRRPAPATIPFLRSPESPLTDRHAVVAVFPVDDAVRSRFATYLEEARRRGLDAAAAVRDAKLHLRAERQPDPKRPAFPTWAAFALRGAP
jgi:hypothetical protein